MQTARSACHIGGMKGRENGMVEMIIPCSTRADVISKKLAKLNTGGVNTPKDTGVVEIVRSFP